MKNDDFLNTSFQAITHRCRGSLKAGVSIRYAYQWPYMLRSPSEKQAWRMVNCGRTMNNGGWYADGGTRCPIEEHYALPKDGYCHLWEKRNVTDDDYPERRTDEE